MTNFLESENHASPSQVKNEFAGRLKDTKGIKSLELVLKGDSMDAKDFGRTLVALKKRGVKISHDVSIRLDFPRAISRDSALALVESLPKPRNGSLKVRLEVESRRIAGKS